MCMYAYNAKTEDKAELKAIKKNVDKNIVRDFASCKVT